MFSLSLLHSSSSLSLHTFLSLHLFAACSLLSSLPSIPRRAQKLILLYILIIGREKETVFPPLSLPGPKTNEMCGTLVWMLCEQSCYSVNVNKCFRGTKELICTGWIEWMLLGMCWKLIVFHSVWQWMQWCWSQIFSIMFFTNKDKHTNFQRTNNLSLFYFLDWKPSFEYSWISWYTELCLK